MEAFLIISQLNLQPLKFWTMPIWAQQVGLSWVFLLWIILIFIWISRFFFAAANNQNNELNLGDDGQWNPMEWDRAAEELTWERLLGLDGSLVFLEHVFWVSTKKAADWLLSCWVDSTRQLSSQSEACKIQNSLPKITHHMYVYYVIWRVFESIYNGFFP